ncbi:hypothetical protein PsYK624_058070 [Phanerochaete sordida]|uniref:F-box domain-containing protein n=1 Tax=Phanerochaete sordida TaxID=48140 RepID=A0A9P3G7K9_9APHY|nr:hypothetical protein PsYK624_058070 [Phanerochaete sordida]
MSRNNLASEARLPEELLRENILILLLSTSEESFCVFPFSGCLPWIIYRHSGHPTSKPPPSCSALLVCKRWLRVGTPLLYESLSIWSPSHTKAVAALIRSNPIVGKAIRRLRIEGGCGKNLHTIVRHAPNVHTLYICVHVKASEGIAGLRKALPLLQPRKLYWQHSYLRSNKPATEAKELLQKCIAGGWTSLRSVVLDESFDMNVDIATALSTAPALEDLVLENNSNTRQWAARGFYNTIGQNPRLKEIRMMSVTGKDKLLASLQEAGTSERVTKMFTFLETRDDRWLADYDTSSSSSSSSSADESSSFYSSSDDD